MSFLSYGDESLGLLLYSPTTAAAEEFEVSLEFATPPFDVFLLQIDKTPPLHSVYANLYCNNGPYIIFIY